MVRRYHYSIETVEALVGFPESVLRPEVQNRRHTGIEDVVLSLRHERDIALSRFGKHRFKSITKKRITLREAAQ
jgi:hypothetical protein